MSHIEENKKKDKHGGEEPDKKPDKAAENKECDEKEGEKVSVGNVNVVFHLRSLRWRKSAITSAKGRVFPASTSARPSCSLLYSSMRPAISS